MISLDNLLRRCRSLSFLYLTASVTLLASAPSVMAQEITLRIHHFLPAGGIQQTKMLQPWCDQIGKQSNGRLKCQIFPSMQLGGTPAQLIDQARDGVVDAVFILPGYTAGRFPAMEVFELPFMNRSAESASKAAWEFYLKHGQKEWVGLKPLAFATHDNGFIHTRDKPIRQISDLKGMRMRAPTRLTNKLLASLGASPVGMPVNSVGDAINKGVIDGFMLPWEVMPGLKLHEMVRFHTETPADRPALYTAVFVFAMNQKRYETLPADLRQIVDQASGLGLSGLMGRVWDESQNEGRAPAASRGNTIIRLSQAETDKMQTLSAALAQEWVAQMDKAGANGQQMLDDARQLIRRHDQTRSRKSQ
jgi:TRAP-type C4-dicarboxylate transport system substrate-binding protein